MKSMNSTDFYFAKANMMGLNISSVCTERVYAPLSLRIKASFIGCLCSHCSSSREHKSRFYHVFLHILNSKLHHFFLSKLFAVSPLFCRILRAFVLDYGIFCSFHRFRYLFALIWEERTLLNTTF